MKSVWYLLAVVLGAFGALGLFRSFERLAAGAGVSPVQLIICLVGFLLAWRCVAKARATPDAQGV